MVFSSFEYILFFLPLTVVVFVLLQQRNLQALSSWWLTLASLVFYGWWNTGYLLLPVGSALFNYVLGRQLLAAKTPNRPLLIIGLAANLGLLGYYKYVGFFMGNLAALGLPVAVPQILLPLAISFCTFQQISFLVDCYRQEVQSLDFRRYLLYIVFFPHLIAGPVVRHYELLPQLEKPRTLDTRWHDIVWGLHLFAIGLFKKAVLADTLAGYADPVFHSAVTGPPGMLEAWGGALAYTLQLYFDFSGYADMALGAARMLGIHLPENFNSPYKATSIADFWRRWHMTLSHFLRDYLYIPLGGSRRGSLRTSLNVLITMLLGGLWHGAAWTFVLWGAMHGAALAVCHVWRNLSMPRGRLMPSWLGWSLTMLFVVIGWVVFRSNSLAAAGHMLTAMFNPSLLVLPRELSGLGALMDVSVSTSRQLGALPDSAVFLYIPALVILCRFAPNSQEWMARGWGAPENLTPLRALLLALVLAVCFVFLLGNNEVFIYYVF
jgi:alginate O-acetyltransferase complex protein AlgI